MSQNSLPPRPTKAPVAQLLYAIFAVPQRWHYSVKDKIRIMLEGLRGEQSGGVI